MTFKEKALEMLTANGMFDDEAAEVFERIVADGANAAMQGRWNDDVSGYPEMMVNVLWLTVKTNAAEWIAEHRPLAWYRPLFEDPVTV